MASLERPGPPPASVDDCTFYHSMELPGLGLVHGLWDLRPTLDDYVARFDFAGRSLLDVGAASGFVSFEAERRGARVVSVDIARGEDWDFVPYAAPGYDPIAAARELSERIERVKRSYRLAHSLLGSQARVHSGNAYALPESLGTFDVVMLGMILPHLRDPFRALASAAARSHEWMIVTQQSIRSAEPVMRFQPDPVRHEDPRTWWILSEGCTERMLSVLGFEVTRKVRARHLCVVRGHREVCTAFLARRGRALATR